MTLKGRTLTSSQTGKKSYLFFSGIHKIFKISSLTWFFGGNAIFRCQLGTYFLPNPKNPNPILLFHIFFLPQIIMFDSFLDFPLYFLYKCKGNRCLCEDVRVCPLKGERVVAYIMADIGHNVRIAYQTLQNHCNIARKPSGRCSQWLTSLADSWFAHSTIKIVETNGFPVATQGSRCTQLWSWKVTPPRYTLTRCQRVQIFFLESWESGLQTFIF